MPRKLVLVNVLLLALAALSVVYIGRGMMAPMPMPMPQAGRARPAATVTERTETPRAAAGAYQVVSARNLFSPTRSEAPAGPVTAVSAAAKPNLHGIVLRDGAPIAYLEDPTTKRTAGYRVGDSVGGGTVQAINADGVVINRPDGNMDVRLRDPSKPRTVAAPATPGQPGAVPGGAPSAAPGVVQGQSPAIGLPGVIPPQTQPGVPHPSLAQPQPPGVVQPPTVTPPQVFPGRRPLPPNLLRRIPPAQPSDAPQQ